jgi:hypothetical protein
MVNTRTVGASTRVGFRMQNECEPISPRKIFEEFVVTKTPAKLQWTRPELVLLGRIEDVAGTLGTKVEGVKHLRS